jgi:hypothetical protein
MLRAHISIRQRLFRVFLIFHMWREMHGAKGPVAPSGRADKEAIAQLAKAGGA